MDNWRRVILRSEIHFHVDVHITVFVILTTLIVLSVMDVACIGVYFPEICFGLWHDHVIIAAWVSLCLSFRGEVKFSLSSGNCKLWIHDFILGFIINKLRHVSHRVRTAHALHRDFLFFVSTGWFLLLKSKFVVLLERRGWRCIVSFVIGFTPSVLFGSIGNSKFRFWFDLSFVGVLG